jgi:hypothetical protein
MGQLIVPFGATAAMVAVLCSLLVAAGLFYILNVAHRAKISKLL